MTGSSRRPLALLLLLALAASAQEPWTEKQIESQLSAAQGKLAKAPEDAALLRRVDLLKELLGTVQDRGRFLDVQVLRDRKAAAEASLEALRAQPPSPPKIAAREDVAPYEAAAVEADALFASAQKALDEALARQKALQAESATLPARIAESKRLNGDESDGLGELEVRAAQERSDFCRDALERLKDRVPMHQAERELARLRADRAQADLAKAREEWAARSERLAAEERDRAEAKEREAARASDPIERFRQQKAAELTRLQADTARDDAYYALLEQRIAAQQKAGDALEVERGRLSARFASAGTYSERLAALLLGSLERFRLSRDVLVRHTLPALYREMGLYQNARAETQGDLFELESVPEENLAWLALLRSVGPEREAEARQAFNAVMEGEKGLLARLRARAELLDRIEGGLVQLESEATRRLQSLDSALAFILANILWVKSEPTVGPAVVTGTAEEIGKLALFYTKKEVRREIAASYREAPAPFVGVVGGIGLALVLGVYAARRLSRMRAWANYRGGPFWVAVQKILVALLLALLVPLLLHVIRLLVGLVTLPDVVAQPLLRFLDLFARIWFVRRFCWRLLRAEDGIAVADLGTSPEVAAQLWRAVRHLTTAAFFFLIPSEILAAEPFSFVHLPRLLYPCYLGGVAVALVPLVLRRGAFVKGITGGRGFAHFVAGAVGSLLALGFAAIVAMDLLGYRYGASQLSRNAIRTIAAAILLAGLNRLLRRLVEKVARRVRSRAVEQEGYAAAWEQSKTVMHQLSRVVAAAVLFVAFLVIMNSWELDRALRAFFEGARLLELDGGSFLSLWDVLNAAIWIGGAHFLLANISGVYEFLVFPLLGGGGGDRGVRFVMLALSRYAILLVAYSAALLTLHFSFASVGWLLAAASVGIGFGLQEIIANFVSGLILLLEQPVRVGDIISVGDTGGTVEKINIRATVVTNWNRQQIIVPNKNFITQELTNWTRNDDLIRRVISVGVAYGSDVPKVLAILKEITEAHPEVVKDPPPRIWFEAFGASSLDFEIWCFVRITEGKQTMTEIRTRIAERFAKEGIEIPFPQRDLHIRTMPDDAMVAGMLERRPGRHD